MSKYDTGTPFFVIADPRSGGTFLSHCLSSHPDVYCHRRELLHRRDVPRQIFPRAAAIELVRLFIEQQGYLATGLKLVYKEASKRMLRYLHEEGGVAIHLIRQNAIRVAMSREATSRQRQGEPLNYPSQRIAPGKPRSLEVDPLKIIARAREYRAGTQETIDRIADSGVVTRTVIYEEMIDPADLHKLRRDVGDGLCGVLGIPRRRLSCRLFPSAPIPLHRLIENWKEFRVRLVNSELADCLEEGEHGEWMEESGPTESSSEYSSGEQDSAWSYQPRPDDSSGGDSDSVGPECSPVALG